MLADVAEVISVSSHSVPCNDDACLTGELRLAPEGASLEALDADFRRMIKDGMFDVEPPGFDKIVCGSRLLSEEINGRD